MYQLIKYRIGGNVTLTKRCIGWNVAMLKVVYWMECRNVESSVLDGTSQC